MLGTGSVSAQDGSSSGVLTDQQGNGPTESEVAEPTVSGALGVGVFDAQPAAEMDLSADLSGRHYAIGFGARLRWLWDGGFRDKDWDERSEWANLLRYLTYVRNSDNEVRATFALGQLGGVQLGHGSVIDGYSTAIHLDHRRLGAELRVETQSYGLEGVIEAVVAPRVSGLRGYWYRSVGRARLDIGAATIVDWSAPAGELATGSMARERDILPIAVIDGQARIDTDDRRFSGAVYSDLVALATSAVGLHFGTWLGADIDQVRLRLRGELQVGSDRYVAAWMGPLYERDRQVFRAMESQLSTARNGGLGGVGGVLEATAGHPAVGEMALSYRRRPGLGHSGWMRVSAPYFRDIQGALWVAAEMARPDPAWVVASEVRALLPRQLFVSAELARLYRGDGVELERAWIASIALGTTYSPRP